MTWASLGCTPDASRARSSSTSIPSGASVTWCTFAPRLRRLSSVRSYVGRSTTTSSSGPTRRSKRNASACIEPLVISTWSTSTPCLAAIHLRRGGYPTDVPYAVMPAGSQSKARVAAALSPATSMMSMEGAPRAKEMSCSDVMASGYGAAPPGLRRSVSSLLCPHPQDAPHRDHAQHLALVEHHQVAEPAAHHRGRRVLQRPVRVGVDDVPGQVRTGQLDVRVEPAPDRVKNVPFRHDPDALGVPVEYHVGTHPPLAHLRGDLPQCVRRTNDEHGLVHGGADLHVR